LLGIALLIVTFILVAVNNAYIRSLFFNLAINSGLGGASSAINVGIAVKYLIVPLADP